MSDSPCFPRFQSPSFRIDNSDIPLIKLAFHESSCLVEFHVIAKLNVIHAVPSLEKFTNYCHFTPKRISPLFPPPTLERRFSSFSSFLHLDSRVKVQESTEKFCVFLPSSTFFAVPDIFVSLKVS